MLDGKDIQKFSNPLSAEIHDLILSRLTETAFGGEDLAKFIDAQNIASAALLNLLATYMAQTILILADRSNKDPKEVMGQVIEEFFKNVRVNFEKEIPSKVQRGLDAVKKVVFN